MSIFNEHNLLFLRDPAGGVEDVQLMKDSGFNIIALNVQKEIPPAKWDLIRGRAETSKVIVVPWCYIWNTADMDRLCTIQDQWGSPGHIQNPEKQLDEGAFSCYDLAARSAGRDVAISTEPWLFAHVDWSPITDCPMMLQIFPLETDASKRPEDCRKHAHDMGFSCVTMTFGTYDVNDVFPQPDWYDLRTPYQLYTADDMTYWYPNYKIWSPTGNYSPCLPDVEPQPISQFPYTGPYYPLTPYPGQKKRLPDRGKTVKALKLIFEDLGLMVNGSIINNVFGSTLRNALFKWQLAKGIDPATGNYGPKTWESLRTTQIDGKYVVSGEAMRLIQEDDQDG